MTGHVTVPSLAAMVLKKIIEAMTAPRRRSGSAPAQALIGTQDGAWTLTQLHGQHTRGLAFTDLLQHLPTDHLPTKVAATVLVHVDHATLVESVKVARTDVGEPLSAGTARRLACQAGIIPLCGTRHQEIDRPASRYTIRPGPNGTVIISFHQRT